MTIPLCLLPTVFDHILQMIKTGGARRKELWPRLATVHNFWVPVTWALVVLLWSIFHSILYPRQGLCVQQCDGQNCLKFVFVQLLESIATRGSHLCVACWSVCDQDQNFWSVKVPFWTSWSLGFQWVKRSNCSHQELMNCHGFAALISSCSHTLLICWFWQFGGRLDPLINSQKALV